MKKILTTLIVLLCFTLVEPMAAWANDMGETVKSAQLVTDSDVIKYCNGTNVNIRKEPNLDSEVIGVSDINVSFQVIDENNGWSKIWGEGEDYGDDIVTYTGYGYIKSEYLSDKEIEVPEAPEIDLSNYEEVATYDYIATAYDLSVQSCGKRVGSKNYGLTRSGKNISGKTHDEAMCIAVDRRYIPLHTKVYVEFKEDAYKKYNGIYTSLDTGSGVKGKHIDVFMGDYQQYEPHEDTIKFGVRDCTVTILQEKK